MSDGQSAGAFLVAGAIALALSFATLTVVPGVMPAGQGPTPLRLAAIGAHRRAWRWLVALFVSAIVLTAIGSSLLGAHLRDAGDHVLGPTGTTLYTLGAALLLATFAFQLGLTRAGGTDVAHPTFEALDRWSETLYAIYMALAFAAIAVFGVSLIATGTTPVWAAWFSVIFGAAMFTSFVTRVPRFGDLLISDLPLWVQVWGLVLGVALLLVP